MNKSVTATLIIAGVAIATAYTLTGTNAETQPSQVATSTPSETSSQVATSSPTAEQTDVTSAPSDDSSDHDLHAVHIPDFASIRDVKTKKRTFFEYFEPIIDAENDRILALRDDIEQGLPDNRMSELCTRYRINDECTPEALLYKVDIIPTSMVLAQAAVESAWGTSRFAQQANNYFGQWCFTEGCGIVPRQRSSGAAHEVKIFDSPKQAVQAYFLNINSHPAYEPAREIRASAYENDHIVAGSDMVGGLLSYSGIGEHYIEELRSIIRVNHLEEPTEVAQNSGGH